MYTLFWNKQFNQLVFTAILLLLAPLPSAHADSKALELVTQILEPTGGKIQRPKDWHYNEVHNEINLNWFITRENIFDTQPYVTGLHIQAYVDVQKRSGIAAKKILTDFVNAKKSQVKIINICEESNQGLFTRICLEVEENNKHVLYSFFWGNNNLDVAIITVASTNKELWDRYAETFAAMSNFEIIDAKRYIKK